MMAGKPNKRKRRRPTPITDAVRPEPPIPPHRALVVHPNSTFTWELARELCDHIAEGGSLRAFCGRPGKPQKRTVLRWLRENEVFRTQYARAREDQADHFVDEIQEIADDARNDFMDRETRNGTIRILDPEAVARSRLRVDARKWVAGKLRPKVYGDVEAQTPPRTEDSPFIELLKAITPKRGVKQIEGRAIEGTATRVFADGRPEAA
jgi:hypothetical protein